MKKKRLCIVTGSRAEWGIFRPLVKEIKSNKPFILQIIATGAHLSSEFGLTYKEIEGDGFKIDRKVKMLLPGDTEEAITGSVSLGITKLTEALKSLKPDLVFLIGDRFETFAAAIASYFLKIPIAHLYGGELTEGSLDDSLRHAITKLALFHFVSLEQYRQRVIQMGEEPQRVFKVGALALDNIKNMKLLNRNEFERKIRFKLGRKNIMVTFNPSTAEKKEVSEKQFRCLLEATNELRDVKIIFTKPIADMYSRTITRLVDNYVSKNRNRAISFTSMGRSLYWSTLKYMDVVAGNSSSAINEASSFGIPTINIGNRQGGRFKPDTVINVEGNLASIKKAFRIAFSGDFRKCCKNAKNPHGDGNTAKRIIRIIKKMDSFTPKKKFFDFKRPYLQKGGSMKKLVIFVAVLMIAGMSYASDIGMEPLFNKVYDSTEEVLKMREDITTGTVTLHRDGLTVDDTLSQKAEAVGFDASGYKTIRVDIVTGMSTRLYLSPAVWNSTQSLFSVLSGETIIVSTDSVTKDFQANVSQFLDVYGSKVFFQALSGLYGSNPDVYITPIR